MIPESQTHSQRQIPNTTKSMSAVYRILDGLFKTYKGKAGMITQIANTTQHQGKNNNRYLSFRMLDDVGRL